MNRPGGVTIIGILEFLGAGFTLLGGVLFLAAGGTVAALLARERPEVAGIVGTVGAALGIFMLISGAIWLFVALQFWKLKEWARIVVMIFAIIFLCLQALGFLGSMMAFEVFSMLWNGIWAAVYAWIAYYLNSFEAKQAFARG